MANLELHRIGDNLGVEVRGINLFSDVDAATAGLIRDALSEHSVLVFRGQDLAPADIAAFGRKFGRLSPHVLARYRTRDVPEVAYVTNRDAAGNVDSFGVDRATVWHTDETYRADLPWFTMLHGLEVPREKGGTLFTDMRAAYDGLPEAMKQRLEAVVGLHGRHTGPQGRFFAQERGNWISDEQAQAHETEQRHPAVLTHPLSRRKILFVNPLHTNGFVDMEREEGIRLVRDLAAHATQDRFVYYHQWKAGDVVIWDDYATMHRNAGDSGPGQARVFLRLIVRRESVH